MIEALAAARDRSAIAPAVLEVIARQNARWGASTNRRDRLDALRRGAVAIVTGQQLGLGLGPLYTVHKAASAIRIAQALEAEGVPAVPIFWLHSEDHDFEEIRSLSWPAEGVVHTASLPERPSARARTSIAHEKVGPGIDAVLAALEGSPFAARMKAHYLPDASLSDAFGSLLAELFAPFGLLTFDPRNEEIAALAAPLHARALQEHDALSASLVERVAAIESAGGKAPIPIRAECTLSFFHPEGPEGPRYRMIPSADGISLSGAPETFSRAEIAQRLEREPLCFSTSALLRPVLQDHLLPTAAYVGGPSEVAYAAQLAPIYETLGVTAAPFVRRASFVVTSPRDREDLAALSLDVARLAEPEDTLVRGLGRVPVTEEIESLARSVATSIAAMQSALEALDPGLAKTAAKTEATIAQSFDKLRSRAERAAATRDPQRLMRLRRVLASLRPGGAPQERVLGLPAIAELDLDRVAEALVAHALDRPLGTEVELAL